MIAICPAFKSLCFPNFNCFLSCSFPYYIFSFNTVEPFLSLWVSNGCKSIIIIRWSGFYWHKPRKRDFGLWLTHFKFSSLCSFIEDDMKIDEKCVEAGNVSSVEFLKQSQPKGPPAFPLEEMWKMNAHPALVLWFWHLEGKHSCGNVSRSKLTF